MVHVVAPDDVVFSRPRDVDGRPVHEHLVRAGDVVVFDDVVSRVQVRRDQRPVDDAPYFRVSRVLPHRLRVFDLVPADARRALPHLEDVVGLFRDEELRPHAAQADRLAGHVVNGVVGDPVLRTLVQDDPVRMPENLPEVVEMVVHDLVVPVDILRAGTVSEQEDAGAAEVAEFVAGDDDSLAMQVQPDGLATAVEEPAVFDPAVFRTPQAEQSVALVDHRPVVLDRHVVVGDGVPVALGEGETVEHDAPDGRVRRAFDIDVALDAHQLHQGRREDLVAGLLLQRPEVEFLLFRIEDPLSGVGQALGHVFDRGRRLAAVDAPRRLQHVAALGRRLGQVPFLVDELQWQDRHGVSEADDEFHVLQVVPIPQGAIGKAEIPKRIERAFIVGHVARAKLEFPWRRHGAPQAHCRRVETVGLRAGESPVAIVEGAESSKVRRHVGYPHVRLRHVGEALGDIPVQLPPPLESHARREDRFLAGVGGIGDRLAGIRGVFQPPNDSLREVVPAASNPDDDVLVVAPLLQFPHGIARSRERRERTVRRVCVRALQCAGPGIVTVRGDIEIGVLLCLRVHLNLLQCPQSSPMVSGGSTPHVESIGSPTYTRTRTGRKKAHERTFSCRAHRRAQTPRHTVHRFLHQP